MGFLILGAAIAVQSAGASQVISTSTVQDIKLGVNDKGQAIVSYMADGKQVHVLAWGAVNAIPPTASGKQVAFTLDYSGGQTLFNDDIAKAVAQLRADQAKFHAAQAAAAKGTVKYTPDVLKYSKAIADDNKAVAAEHALANNYFTTFTCPKYTGPQLAWFVTACTAPDGSYWAVQSWQRQLPDYGVNPTATQAAVEVHLAHWTGPLPVLTVQTDWSYHQWEHLFGTYTYDGHAIFGFKSTPAGQPLDTFGRNLYLDSLDSDYGGTGWKRVNSWLTHSPNGAWCYGLSPHLNNLTGAGTQYRLSTEGPGVTPDVMATASPPNPASKVANTAAILALNDKQCKPH